MCLDSPDLPKDDIVGSPEGSTFLKRSFSSLHRSRGESCEGVKRSGFGLSLSKVVEEVTMVEILPWSTLALLRAGTPVLPLVSFCGRCSGRELTHTGVHGSLPGLGQGEVDVPVPQGSRDSDSERETMTTTRLIPLGYQGKG